ncbi:MAG: carbohydrate-binding protein [Kiritimatiellia bacterium]
MQAAINGAPDGSEIVVAPGTYTEYLTALDLNKNLYFRASGGPDVTIISGAGTNKLLYIANGVNGDSEKNLVFDGFTFANGREFGTAVSPVTLADCKPLFLSCIFENNRAARQGGAVLIFGTLAHPVFVGCTFRGNVSERTGGAALINGGRAQVTFKECLFENNTNRIQDQAAADNGGGALYFAVAGGNIFDCEFINNSCSYAGGAITSITPLGQPEDLVTISGSRFIDNFADPLPGLTPAGNTEAGAIFSEGSFRIRVDRCYFEGNYAEGGGAMQSFRAHFEIRNSVFYDNHAVGGLGTGGAVSFSSNDFENVQDYREGTLVMENVLIQSCTGHAGGGIYHTGDQTYSKQGDITLTNVAVVDCSSTAFGSQSGHAGGIWLQNSNLVADRLFLLNNTADGGGGAVTLVLDTDINATNSYVIGNDANGNDGVFNPDNNTPNWNGSYFGHNPPGSGGGALNLLESVLPLTFQQSAYLAYAVIPDAGSPTLLPGNLALTDRGAFRSGVSTVTNQLENVQYSLSNDPGTTANVNYSRFIPESSYLTPETSVPAFVEAENYDLGGRGVSYWDSSAGNLGTTYRSGDQVEIAALGSASNGHFVGWIQAGEWLEYTVNVPTSGNYEIYYRVASPSTGGKMYLQVNGETQGSITSIPNTGGWGTFGDVAGPVVTLEKGWSKIRVISAAAGYNFDGIDIRLQATDPVLAWSPSALTANVRVGTSTVTRNLSIWNSGVNTLTYTVVGDQPWISIPSPNGSSTGETDSVQVQFDTSSMTEGQYTGTVTIQSNGTNGNQNVPVTVTVLPDRLNPLDVDGDGRADIANYDPSNNTFTFLQSGNSQTRNYVWGLLPSDVPVVGDYDGDGLADAAVLQLNGTWHLARTAANYAGLQLGSPGVIPVPADYDGDGATDMAIYEPWSGVWHLSMTRDGYFGRLWGIPGDIPVPADYDGDGEADLAVFRPSDQTWHILASTDGETTRQWGLLPTDLPVPGDYDGDGIEDLAVYQANGTWHLARSAAGYAGLQLGAPGDIPVPADYDGDGAIDMAIFQPNGVWHLSQTTEGYRGLVFGKSGDLPVKQAPRYP